MIFCSITCSHVQEALQKSSSKSTTGLTDLTAHLFKSDSGYSAGCQALENCPHFVLESPGDVNGGENLTKCLSEAKWKFPQRFICALVDFQILGVFFKLKWILNFLTFKWLFLDNVTVPLRTLKAVLHISNSVVACFAWESLSEQLCVWLLV